ncbi:MAG: hypothetical protein RLZZ595_288 [Bacteroidota bacterium]|jgi:hypothetical protein
MLRYILLGFAIYFAYRFIVGFVVPVYKTTKQVKKQFNAMREQQEQYAQGPTPTPEKKPQGVDKSDYIDFEEIKD